MWCGTHTVGRGRSIDGPPCVHDRTDLEDPWCSMPRLMRDFLNPLPPISTISCCPVSDWIMIPYWIVMAHSCSSCPGESNPPAHHYCLDAAAYSFSPAQYSQGDQKMVQTTKHTNTTENHPQGHKINGHNLNKSCIKCPEVPNNTKGPNLHILAIWPQMAKMAQIIPWLTRWFKIAKLIGPPCPWIELHNYSTNHRKHLTQDWGQDST